ncbi:hypothetical protein ABZ671_18895 [Micromonospora sp. NPDC006766]|uniref:hypothetical protein n=1 Tax=Micromonospora sp. NPDC006766 TaxID=3154778 RepID=UPI0033CD4521
MPPLPVITPLSIYEPGEDRACVVIDCPQPAVAAWHIARSGSIFGERWIAGQNVDLCRDHDVRAAKLTGAEDYVDQVSQVKAPRPRRSTGRSMTS